MSFDDTSKYMGVVKDPYGREVGRSVGYTLDLSGNITSIGVAHPHGVFREYTMDRIASMGQDIVLLPTWRAEARKAGLERALSERGFLDRRANALSQMLERNEITRKVYEEMYEGLMAIREVHQRISRQLITRLGELRESDDTIDMFLAKVKIQRAFGDTANDTYKSTVDYCSAMKSMNESERRDLNQFLDAIGREVHPAEPKLSAVQGLAIGPKPASVIPQPGEKTI